MPTWNLDALANLCATRLACLWTIIAWVSNVRERGFTIG